MVFHLISCETANSIQRLCVSLQIEQSKVCFLIVYFD